MRKLRLLILSGVLICWSISAISQNNPTTTSDATLVPNSYLRNAAKAIEKGKVDAERVVLLNEKITFLNQRIYYKDSVIKLYSEKDSIYYKVKDTYDAELLNLIEQRDIVIKEMEHQNKLLKRQKRKTVFATIGAAGVTAAIFLLIK